MDLNEIGFESLADSLGSGRDCQHGNELYDSIKGEEFLD
jgi:hypothetical protein